MAYLILSRIDIPVFYLATYTFLTPFSWAVYHEHTTYSCHHSTAFSLGAFKQIGYLLVNRSFPFMQWVEAYMECCARSSLLSLNNVQFSWLSKKVEQGKLHGN